MSNLAINDAGDVLVYDGSAWKPAPTAQNDAGDKVVFDGSAWKPLGALVGATKGSKAQGRSDAAANAFGQGVTFGGGDELSAGVRAVFPKFSNWMMEPSPWQKAAGQVGQTVSTAPTQDQRYDEELARQRGQTKADSAAYPVMTTGANIAGNLTGAAALSAIPGVGALMRGGPSLIGNIAKGAGTGAALGGAQGYLEGEGDNRTGGGVLGAGIGATVGGVLPVAGAVAKAGYERVAPWLLKQISKGADAVTPTTIPKSLSAAAPDGGSPVARDSLAATIAETSRGAAGKIEQDAATKRLALEISRSGGTGQVRNRLGELGEGAFIADANKGTERLANLGASLPGEAPDKYAAAYGQRNRATGQRFVGAMGDEANVPAVADAQKFLQAYKSQTGSELYDPVLRNGKFNISPEMREVMQRTPAIQETMDQITAEAAKYGKDLTPAEVAHLVKQTLNKNTEAAFAGGKAINKDMVRSAGDSWEQALWAANPGIKEADTAYAKVASLPDWLDRGQNFMRSGQGDAAINVSPAALAADIPGATPHQLQALRVGSSNVMRDAASSGPEATRRLAKSIDSNDLMRQKLVEIYGPEAADRLMSRSAAELQFARGNQAVNGGSQTAQRLATQADEAALSIPQGGSGTPASLVQALLNGYAKVRQPSEAVRSRLADLLANPDPAMNAETLRLVQAILDQQKRGRPFSAGTSAAAAGSVGGPQ